ncbi:DNA-binding response regulator, NarL/FixJ family, contains REC and HTH domains [Terriglobus roseus]|uniref:DNA-binding response regulator, NarL/FixJ family, contains REC and HTH domains n=1 Tax=Terriglobus roseus TaxID=392734 RepID=A0A1G7HW15_9BACT|nr:DNA-binding response regulator, NarL/FixJ family, contains REC and HTH domains [Terriglobus roseus]
METGPIRLLVVDDHTLFGESFVSSVLHEPDVTVVGHCATLAELHDALHEQDVDVVLLDYESGKKNQKELLEALSQLRLAARFLLVTRDMDVTELHDVLDVGVSGVVLKHGDPRHLLHAIRAVAEGNQWWDESALRQLPTPVRQSAEMHAPALTVRQQQILQHILDGLSNKEIGAELGVSETAVKASIQELFHKAGVRTRSQLVRVALEKHSEEWLKPRS